jgi:hypothetical protein
LFRKRALFVRCPSWCPLFVHKASARISSHVVSSRFISSHLASSHLICSSGTSPAWRARPSLRAATRKASAPLGAGAGSSAPLGAGERRWVRGVSYLTAHQALAKGGRSPTPPSYGFSSTDTYRVRRSPPESVYSLGTHGPCVAVPLHTHSQPHTPPPHATHAVVHARTRPAAHTTLHSRIRTVTRCSLRLWPIGPHWHTATTPHAAQQAAGTVGVRGSAPSLRSHGCPYERESSVTQSSAAPPSSSSSSSSTASASRTCTRASLLVVVVAQHRRRVLVHLIAPLLHPFRRARWPA